MDNGFKNNYLRRLAPGGLAGVIGQSTGLSTNLARNIVVPRLLDLKGIYVILMESSTADTSTISLTVPLAASFVGVETGNDTSSITLAVAGNISFGITESATADSMSLALGAVVSGSFALTEPSTADTPVFTGQVPVAVSIALVESSTADSSSFDLSVLASLNFTMTDTGSDSFSSSLTLEVLRTISFSITEPSVDDVANFSLSAVNNTNLFFDLVEEAGDDVLTSDLDVVLGLTLDLAENQEDDTAQMDMTVALAMDMDMDMAAIEEGFDTFDMFVQRHLTKQITLYPATRLTPSFTSGVSLSTLKVETRKIPAIGE